MSKQDTIISLLKEIDKNIDNIGGGGTVSKVKVNTLKVTDACINDDGRWGGESLVDFSECTSLNNAFSRLTKLKILDTTGWDLSKVTDFTSFIDNNKGLEKIIGIKDWDTSSATTFSTFGRSAQFVDIDIDLRKWNVSNVLNLGGFFTFATSGRLNIENWDTKKVTNFGGFLYAAAGVTWVNMVGTSAISCTAFSNALSYVGTNTLVGDYSIDDVINNNLKVLDGAKVNINITSAYVTNLNRASLRALINGLADLTGSDAKTFTIGEINIAKLTEEDIAIATAKNWTIA